MAEARNWEKRLWATPTNNDKGKIGRLFSYGL
jgi:hypothetical protein